MLNNCNVVIYTVTHHSHVCDEKINFGSVICVALMLGYAFYKAYFFLITYNINVSI